jgi:8-oxo-dGTP diphosphatase
MEIWDILDINGNKTGKTKIRGHKLNKSEYHLVIHVWIKNSKGQYLVQKRATDLKVMPDIWAVTGGSAVSGEDSLTSAVREVEEELELRILDCFIIFIQNTQSWYGRKILRPDIKS